MSDPNFVDPAAPSAPAHDRYGDLFTLLDFLKNRDAIEAQARQLRELEIRIAVERENLDDAKTERGDLEARAAALDKFAAELGLREREQNAKFDDARNELVAQHRKLVEIETAIKFRILRHAGALVGFNPELQSVPSFDTVDRMIGVPVDTISEMRAPGTELAREGWSGDKFSEQSTLTRSVPMSEHDDLPMPRPPDPSATSRRRARRAGRRVSL
jgi:hypothetical protein